MSTGEFLSVLYRNQVNFYCNSIDMNRRQSYIIHIRNVLLGLYVTWSSTAFIYIPSPECLRARFEVTQYTGHLKRNL